MRKRDMQLFLLLGVLTLTSLFSCGVDRWSEYYPLTGRNLWIDSIMREEYLWFEDIPSSKGLNYFLDAQAFLKAILSPLDKNYSTVDSLYITPPASYGFDYTLYNIVGNDTAYNALISYVMPGSPAAVSGLKRGEWIMMINDDYITRKTEALLVEGEDRELLIGKYTTLENEEGEEVGAIQPDRAVALPASWPVEDDAIPAYNVFSNGNLRVGYLVYNSFSAEYNDRLLQLSQFYKENNVTDFVLDLRYNTGGEMECVQLLADMLVPADRLGSPLASLRYNQKQEGVKNRELMLDPQLLQGGFNLNLPKVYILTGSETAAASEMLINCLKPYMTVILIGSTTKGETIATESFSNHEFLWVLHAAVCEVFNSQGVADYSEGFVPDYAVGELGDPAKVLPLGDQNETLLNEALGIINGSIELPEPEPETPLNMKAVKSTRVKRTFHGGLIIK